MSIFDGFKQNLIKEGVGLLKHFFPGKMSEEQESNALLAVTQMANNFTIQAQASFDLRVKELEGTASDLKQFGVIGKMIIFLRGVQRPVWGFATLVIDFYWLSGTWTLTEEQSNAAYLINFLVLGFLFGERTLKNLEPLLTKIFAK